jgi:tetratricopeptide (TPR) repeat protein
MEHWGVGLIVAASYGIGDGWDEALALADEVIAAPLSLSDEGRSLTISSVIRSARGEDVRPALARLEEIAEKVNEGAERAGALAIRAALAFQDGEFDSSRDLYIRAADTFQPLDSVYLAEASHAAAWARDVGTLRAIGDRQARLGQAHLPPYRVERERTLASAAALEGDIAPATQRYRLALQMYEDLGQRFDGARAAVDAVWLLGTTDPQIAKAAADAAALFEALGAKPYLAKLEEAKRRPHETARAAEAVSVS